MIGIGFMLFIIGSSLLDGNGWVIGCAICAVGGAMIGIVAAMRKERE